MLAYLLRFNFEVPDSQWDAMWQHLAWVVPLQALLFWRFGLYRGIWRYASLRDFQRILIAAGTSTLVIALTLLLTRPEIAVPRSVILLDPILLIMGMGGNRLAYRAWKERRLSLVSGERTRVVILGAGDAGALLLKHLAVSDRWTVVGLLDDNPAKHGREIQGIPILGPISSLARIVTDHSASQAVVAMPGAGHKVRRAALEMCRQAGIPVLTVPSYSDIIGGRVTISELRPVELDDLLGRDPVILDNSGLAQWIGAQTVLVTGAGGSIGAELCRQILRFGPRNLILLEQSEFALYQITEELTSAEQQGVVRPVIGDVKDEMRLAEIFIRYRPSIVFHAAAYKHVPLLEEENGWQAARNNVGGTLATARAAIAAGVGKFVLVSTDKAVNPTNVMGATKQLAEMVCRTLTDHGTRFVIVRFGNVLGSAGSVIPKFREQIARGGPVTVTHPDIQRYFMSIPEAAQLVLQAGLMGGGGEVFVLDMGDPVRIVDLARDMIRLSGASEETVPIEFTGLRKGEKLFEELLADGEELMGTPHPKLRAARARPGLGQDEFRQLCDWVSGAAPPDDTALRSALKQFASGYRPAG